MIADGQISVAFSRGNINTTINIAIRTIKAVFSWAANKEQGYLKESPFAKFKLLKVHKRAYEIIEGRDQVAKLFEVVGDNKRYRIIMALYVYCGGRRKEIWQLEWKDIKDNYIIFGYRKNSEDTLQVPVVAPLKTILNEYGYKKHVGRIVDVRKDQMSKQIKVYLKKAGLGKMRPHDLRHSLASHLLMQGVDIKTVQQILGHTSPITTSQVYSHVLKSHVKESISKLPY